MRRACCSTVNRSRWTTWSRAPYDSRSSCESASSRSSRAASSASPGRTARLRVRSPPSRGGRPSPPPRRAGRGPSPPPRTGRTPRRCAAPAARRPRASAPTCPAGGRGTPRRRRARAMPRAPRARRAARRRRRWSAASPRRRDPTPRRRGPRRRCPSRARVAARPGRPAVGRPPRRGRARAGPRSSTTVLAPSTWSATYCDTAIWPSTRRVPQRVTGRVRRRVPRGRRSGGCSRPARRGATGPRARATSAAVMCTLTTSGRASSRRRLRRATWIAWPGRTIDAVARGGSDAGLRRPPTTVTRCPSGDLGGRELADVPLHAGEGVGAADVDDVQGRRVGHTVALSGARSWASSG